MSCVSSGSALPTNVASNRKAHFGWRTWAQSKSWDVGDTTLGILGVLVRLGTTVKFPGELLALVPRGTV
jgi:hypothetical protein